MRSTVVGLAFLLGMLGTATAGPKVALTAIEGDSSGSIREAVADALDGKELSVIGAKKTSKTVQKLKIELPDVSAKQAKKLQSELDADAVVLGALGKEDGNKILRFKLFVNGKKVKGFSIQFSNAKSKKFKNTLRDKMVDKLAVAGAAEDDTEKKPTKKVAAKDKDADTEKPNKNKKKKKKTIAAATDDEEDPAPKKKKKKKKSKKKSKKDEPKADGEPDEGDPKPEKKKTAAADEEEEEEEEVDTEVNVTVRAPKLRTANTNAARIDIGVSASARSLTFTFTQELAAAGQDPAPFKPGPVPGARVEGDVYPLAFMNPKSFAAGLGVAFEFDQVLSSKVQTSAEPGSVGKVKQQHYLIGGRYRLALGKSATSPTITAGASLGRRTFVVKSGLMNRDSLDLPDTDYKYIAPMLGFRLPFTQNIAFVLAANAMLVSDAGPISRGDSYGRAKVFGIDGRGGVDIVLGNRFALRFLFEYSQVGFTFTGGGDKANNRDGDATTPDIGGALDRSLGGVGTLAVLY